MIGAPKVRAGLAGATGYAGRELIRLLARHNGISLVSLAHGPGSPDACVSSLFPELAGICDLTVQDCESLINDDSLDVVFLALPHSAAMPVARQLLERNVRVIDFSADYRLKNATVYEQWYGVHHADAENLAKAVYGLCEWYREQIASATLVANPGCYPTGALLPLLPLLKDRLIDDSRIIIDAKSGVSGAGKKVSPALQFCEVNESFKAYGLFSHRHSPEINQELSFAAGLDVSAQFTPHLLPVQRGILSTIYCELRPGLAHQDVARALHAAYDGDFFVRVKPPGTILELKHVVFTNFCDISFFVQDSHLILVSVIDNMVKGAAGQALQCCNCMFGFPESEGLL